MLSALVATAFTGLLTDLVKVPKVLVWQSDTSISPAPGGLHKFEVVLRTLGRDGAKDVAVQFLAKRGGSCPHATVEDTYMQNTSHFGERPFTVHIDSSRHNFNIPEFPPRDWARLVAIVNTARPTKDCAVFAPARVNREGNPQRGHLLWMRLRVIPWFPAVLLFAAIAIVLVALVAAFPRFANLLPPKEQ